MLKNTNYPDLGKTLSMVPMNALQAAWLESNAARAAQLTPSDVLRQYESNQYTQPSELNQRSIIEFEHMVSETLPPSIDLVELSPVTAFGSNSVLSDISQNNIMVTSRNTEVVADAVTALTLEAARRKRIQRKDVDSRAMSLGSFHRELRTQQHVQPGFLPHFHALSLVTSKFDKSPVDFVSSELSNHTQSYINIISNATRIGYDNKGIGVGLSNIRIMELLVNKLNLDRAQIMRSTQLPGYKVFENFNIPLPETIDIDNLSGIVESLDEEFEFLKKPLLYMERSFEGLIRALKEKGLEDLHIWFDVGRHAGIGYYQDLCVKISAMNEDEKVYPLVDIGTNDWMAKIFSNKNERLITGGMGTELFMNQFRV